MVRALVPLAHEFEELEAVALIDVFRRAGWEVVAAGLEEGEAVSTRGVRIVPDAQWDDVDVDSFDLLVLPGGLGGTRRMCDNQRLLDAVKRFVESDKYVAAICAAPLALQAAGVLTSREATSHPSVRDQLKDVKLVDKSVVRDGKLITSQGAGTAMPFALAIVAEIEGEEKAAELARAMMVPG